MSASYRPAPEVREIAERLISKHYPHLEHPEVSIHYFFVEPTPKKAGKEVLGECRKLSSLQAFLLHHDEMEPAAATEQNPCFAIVISEDAWRVLAEDQRKALVDHELSHAGVEEDDGEIKLKILPHDIEEFAAVVERHGLWMHDLKAFVRRVSAVPEVQMQLEFMEDQSAATTTIITIDGRKIA